MDDLTLLNPSTIAVESTLIRLKEFMDWRRMKCKTKKSRSLVLKSGKLIDFHFILYATVTTDEIPTIQEQPVKSLDRGIPMT